MCTDLAGIIGGGIYFSDHPEKSKNLKEWTNGAMFATGSLGAGLDVKGILDVFHIGIPYGMISYVQESGRAGRAGEIVKSKILITNWEFERLKETDPDELKEDDRVMRELIISCDCRRKVMGRYLNGEELSCLDIDGELCDNCSSGNGNGAMIEKRRREEEEEVNVVKRVRKIEEREKYVKERHQMESGRLELIENHLEICKTTCGACWVMNGWEVAEHCLNDCKDFKLLIGEDYNDWKKKNIKYVNFLYY